MKKKWITLYAASYGTVKAEMKVELDFSEAERIGKQYCSGNNYIYRGTYDAGSIEVAETECRLELYGNSKKVNE